MTVICFIASAIVGSKEFWREYLAMSSHLTTSALAGEVGEHAADDRRRTTLHYHPTLAAL